MAPLPGSSQDDFFPTTRWTLVTAAREGGQPSAAKALDELCRVYRRPLLVYLERRFQSKHDAEDMVQEYFLSLLSRRYWAVAVREKGRFRMFLLCDLKLFLARKRRWREAGKRGASAVHVPSDSVELPDADAALALGEAETSFEQAWAREVFGLSLGRLREDYATPRRKQILALLLPYLDRRGGQEIYGRVAAVSGKSNEAVARQFREMKQRLRFHLRSVVRDTVEDSSDVAAELAWLFRALGAASPEP